jgi:RNA polymerase sigma factor (sigma-70 family)
MKPPISPPIDSYYADVSRFQLKLSEEEKIKLLERHREIKKEIQIIVVKETYPILEKIYWETIAKKKSIAKLTCLINSKKKGYNLYVSKIVQKGIKKKDFSDIPLAAKVIDELISHIKSKDKLKKIKTLRTELCEIEQTISRTALMAAISVAKIYASKVFGIEMKDAIQEANKGIIEAIENYDLDYRTYQGKRVKFLTYAYQNAIKKVKEYIMNQSRLVRLPRSKLEKLFLVIEATGKLNSTNNLSVITREVNYTLKKRKKRVLKESEVVLEEDVLEAIKHLQSGTSISLDSLDSNEFDRGDNSIADILVDDKLNAEQEISNKKSDVNLREVLKKNLNELEYWVIQYKYFNFAGERSLEEIRQALINHLGKKLSRQRINQIKIAAIEKLKLNEELREALQEVTRDNF